eukprot:PhM_4_TR1324/c0_g1_i2/m.101144
MSSHWSGLTLSSPSDLVTGPYTRVTCVVPDPSDVDTALIRTHRYCCSVISCCPVLPILNQTTLDIFRNETVHIRNNNSSINNKLDITPSRLAQFLLHTSGPRVLLIHGEGCSARCVESLNSVFDENDSLFDASPIRDPHNLRIIAFVSYDHIQTEKFATPFFERLATHIHLEGEIITCPNNNNNDTIVIDHIRPPTPHELQTFSIFDVREDDAWYDLLFGCVGLDSNGEFIQRRGVLLTHLLECPERSIHLQNVPRFGVLMLKLLGRCGGSFTNVFGETAPISNNISINCYRGYSYEELKRALQDRPICYASSSSSSSGSAALELVVNYRTTSQIFDGFVVHDGRAYPVDSNNTNNSSVRVTSSLPLTDWLRLCPFISQPHHQYHTSTTPSTVLVHNDVAVPSILQPFVRKSASGFNNVVTHHHSSSTRPKYTVDSFVHEFLFGINTHSCFVCVECTEITALLDALYRDIQTFRPVCVISITPETEYSDIFARIYTTTKEPNRTFHRNDSILLRAMEHNCLVVLIGLETNASLQRYFETMMHSTPYIMPNGRAVPLVVPQQQQHFVLLALVRDSKQLDVEVPTVVRVVSSKQNIDNANDAAVEFLMSILPSGWETSPFLQNIYYREGNNGDDLLKRVKRWLLNPLRAHSPHRYYYLKAVSYHYFGGGSQDNKNKRKKTSQRIISLLSTIVSPQEAKARAWELFTCFPPGTVVPFNQPLPDESHKKKVIAHLDEYIIAVCREIDDALLQQQWTFLCKCCCGGSGNYDDVAPLPIDQLLHIELEKKDRSTPLLPPCEDPWEGVCRTLDIAGSVCATVNSPTPDQNAQKLLRSRPLGTIFVVSATLFKHRNSYEEGIQIIRRWATTDSASSTSPITLIITDMERGGARTLDMFTTLLCPAIPQPHLRLQHEVFLIRLSGKQHRVVFLSEDGSQLPQFLYHCVPFVQVRLPDHEVCPHETVQRIVKTHIRVVHPLLEAKMTKSVNNTNSKSSKENLVFCEGMFYAICTESLKYHTVNVPLIEAAAEFAIHEAYQGSSLSKSDTAVISEICRLRFGVGYGYRHSRLGDDDMKQPPFAVCVVCAEKYDSDPTWTIFAQCGHALHRTCASSWLKSGTNSCPTCRAWIADRSDLKERIVLPIEVEFASLVSALSESKQQFCLTPSTYVAAQTVFNVLWLNRRSADVGKIGVILEGPSGRGKDVMLRSILNGLGFEEDDNNENNNNNKTPRYIYVNATLGTGVQMLHAKVKRAATLGYVIVISELNLLDSDFIESLLLHCLGDVRNRHQNFVLFATVNPADTTRGRATLSSDIMRHFLYRFVDSYDEDDLKKVVDVHYSLPRAVTHRIVRHHANVLSTLSHRLIVPSVRKLLSVAKAVHTLTSKQVKNEDDASLHDSITKTLEIEYALYSLSSSSTLTSTGCAAVIKQQEQHIITSSEFSVQALWELVFGFPASDLLTWSRLYCRSFVFQILRDSIIDTTHDKQRAVAFVRTYFYSFGRSILQSAFCGLTDDDFGQLDSDHNNNYSLNPLLRFHHHHHASLVCDVVTCRKAFAKVFRDLPTEINIYLQSLQRSAEQEMEQLILVEQQQEEEHHHPPSQTQQQRVVFEEEEPPSDVFAQFRRDLKKEREEEEERKAAREAAQRGEERDAVIASQQQSTGEDDNDDPTHYTFNDIHCDVLRTIIDYLHQTSDVSALRGVSSLFTALVEEKEADRSGWEHNVIANLIMKSENTLIGTVSSSSLSDNDDNMLCLELCIEDRTFGGCSSSSSVKNWIVPDHRDGVVAGTSSTLEITLSNVDALFHPSGRVLLPTLCNTEPENVLFNSNTKASARSCHGRSWCVNIDVVSATKRGASLTYTIEAGTATTSPTVLYKSAFRSLHPHRLGDVANQLVQRFSAAPISIPVDVLLSAACSLSEERFIETIVTMVCAAYTIHSNNGPVSDKTTVQEYLASPQLTALEACHLIMFLIRTFVTAQIPVYVTWTLRTIPSSNRNLVFGGPCCRVWLHEKGGWVLIDPTNPGVWFSPILTATSSSTSAGHLELEAPPHNIDAVVSMPLRWQRWRDHSRSLREICRSSLTSDFFRNTLSLNRVFSATTGRINVSRLVRGHADFFEMNALAETTGGLRRLVLVGYPQFRLRSTMIEVEFWSAIFDLGILVDVWPSIESSPRRRVASCSELLTVVPELLLFGTTAQTAVALLNAEERETVLLLDSEALAPVMLTFAEGLLAAHYSQQLSPSCINASTTSIVWTGPNQEYHFGATSSIPSHFSEVFLCPTSHAGSEVRLRDLALRHTLVSLFCCQCALVDLDHLCRNVTTLVVRSCNITQYLVQLPLLKHVELDQVYFVDAREDGGPTITVPESLDTLILRGVAFTSLSFIDATSLRVLSIDASTVKIERIVFPSSPMFYNVRRSIKAYISATSFDVVVQGTCFDADNDNEEKNITITLNSCLSLFHKCLSASYHTIMSEAYTALRTSTPTRCINSSISLSARCPKTSPTQGMLHRLLQRNAMDVMVNHKSVEASAKYLRSVTTYASEQHCALLRDASLEAAGDYFYNECVKRAMNVQNVTLDYRSSAVALEKEMNSTGEDTTELCLTIAMLLN